VHVLDKHVQVKVRVNVLDLLDGLGLLVLGKDGGWIKKNFFF